jgi:Na+/serine symporter
VHPLLRFLWAVILVASSLATNHSVQLVAALRKRVSQAQRCIHSLAPFGCLGLAYLTGQTLGLLFKRLVAVSLKANGDPWSGL